MKNWIICICCPDLNYVTTYTGLFTKQECRKQLRSILLQEVIETPPIYDGINNRLPNLTVTNESGLPIKFNAIKLHKTLANAYKEMAP